MKKSVKTALTVLLCAFAAFALYKFFTSGGAPAQDSEAAVPTQSIVIEGITEQTAQTAAPLNLNADSAEVTNAFGDLHEITDRAALNDLETLLAPIYDAKKSPQNGISYNICFYCGDMCVGMDVYLDEDAAFADSGSGPFLVSGKPDEIEMLLK